MIPELEIGGVLFSSMLAAVPCALLGVLLVRWLLMRLGAHRSLWHPALVEASLFVILWGVAVSVPLPGHP